MVYIRARNQGKRDERVFLYRAFAYHHDFGSAVEVGQHSRVISTVDRFHP